ncbi:tRNA glutamyl-Q(34) synthetase GluQRS [Novosphingopyxis iocasae]|uniref:tRNA glutamyl-Q(34) synthetase GluQRS n=1 Tax=Novosphingopyxis iocasae TaxID=2762729 RepID=UPI001650E403|nr:tRNA glutamyl-Q(34) synthetase GluQRS [Novosphingopyxis iocasae]
MTLRETSCIIVPPRVEKAVDSPAITRFAPSPNGPLHLGHAWSALACHDLGRASGGRFLVRIEDIDGTRSRAEHIDGALADLAWLGLEPDELPLRQSAHILAYRAAFEKLRERGLAYRCWCTRKEIAEALRHSPVRHGPDGPAYPGTCRHAARGEHDVEIPHSWRLDMAAAVEAAGPLGWRDLMRGEVAADPGRFGDIVLWRKDAPASYHLAATVDDAAQGIGPVVRGMDLFDYTDIHVLLQALLGLPQPLYWHHELLLGPDGEKLAKSKAAPALADRRAAGENGRALADELRRGCFPAGISLSNS